MKLSEVFQKMGEAKQFWIRPDGDYLIPCKYYHFVTIMMNPEIFDIPDELYRKWKAEAYKYASTYNLDGDAALSMYRNAVDTGVSDEAMEYVYKKGWIRFDLYNNTDNLRLTIYKLDDKAKRAITTFTKNLNENKLFQWLTVSINKNTKISIYQVNTNRDSQNYSVNDILKGYLEES